MKAEFKSTGSREEVQNATMWREGKGPGTSTHASRGQYRVHPGATTSLQPALMCPGRGSPGSAPTAPPLPALSCHSLGTAALPRGRRCSLLTQRLVGAQEAVRSAGASYRTSPAGLPALPHRDSPQPRVRPLPEPGPRAQGSWCGSVSSLWTFSTSCTSGWGGRGLEKLRGAAGSEPPLTAERSL